MKKILHLFIKDVQRNAWINEQADKGAQVNRMDAIVTAADGDIHVCRTFRDLPRLLGTRYDSFELAEGVHEKMTAEQRVRLECLVQVGGFRK